MIKGVGEGWNLCQAWRNVRGILWSFLMKRNGGGWVGQERVIFERPLINIKGRTTEKVRLVGGVYSKKNKRDYSPTMKSFIASQKKLRQWSHTCKYHWNCGFMRTYIPCYIGSEYKSSRLHMFFKIGVLKNFEPATLLKETPTPLTPCEICKIYKNTFFTGHGVKVVPGPWDPDHLKV